MTSRIRIAVQAVAAEHVVVRRHLAREVRVQVVLGAVVLHLQHVDVQALRREEAGLLQAVEDLVLLRVAGQQQALAVFLDHEHQRGDVGRRHALEVGDAVPVAQVERGAGRAVAELLDPPLQLPRRSRTSS